MLDISPPKLKLIWVQGALTFARKDLELDAEYIIVQNGTLTIGTEKEPFEQHALITLHGTPDAVDLPIYGSKVLACRFCTLDLHGRPYARSWTRLRESVNEGKNGYDIWAYQNGGVDGNTITCANIECTKVDIAKGDRVIKLQDRVDWPRGSHIIVAPSSFRKDECALSNRQTRPVTTLPPQTSSEVANYLCHRRYEEAFVDEVLEGGRARRLRLTETVGTRCSMVHPRGHRR